MLAPGFNVWAKQTEAHQKLQLDDQITYPRHLHPLPSETMRVLIQLALRTCMKYLQVTLMEDMLACLIKKILGMKKELI